MKKLLHIIFFCILTFLTRFSFAQFTTEQDNKNKWGCSIAINSVEAQVGDPEHACWGSAYGNFSGALSDIVNKSLSLSIIPKRFIRENILLRFEFGMTNLNLSSYLNGQFNSSNSVYNITNQTIEQKIYRYVPGIQWNFMKKKIMESYCGISGVYLHYNAMNYTYHREDRDFPSNTIISLIDDKGTAIGGFALGIGAFAGFNIYLQKHISIGAELSSAMLYYKIGGSYSSTTTSQSMPNPPITEVGSYSTNSYKGMQFSKILSSFNISGWF